MTACPSACLQVAGRHSPSAAGTMLEGLPRREDTCSGRSRGGSRVAGMRREVGLSVGGGPAVAGALRPQH